MVLRRKNNDFVKFSKTGSEALSEGSGSGPDVFPEPSEASSFQLGLFGNLQSSFWQPLGPLGSCFGAVLDTISVPKFSLQQL